MIIPIMFTSNLGDVPLTAKLIAEIAGESGGSGIVNTAITTVGNGTLTGAALVGGQITRTGPTGAYTDTTDTAADILAALGTPFAAGETFVARIKNATTFVQTIAAGAGVTFSTTTLVPPLSVGQYFGTVGGTAASPTVTFSHISTVPIHASAQQTNEQASTLTTVGAGTILAASINAGVTVRTGSTGAFTDTTDSVADILAGVSGVANIVGSSVEWTYVNNTVAAATLQGASNVTINGATVVPANSWAKYLVTATSGTAITLTCIGQGFFPARGTFVANGATPVTVSNAAVTAGSQIEFTLKTPGGTVGAVPAVQTITPGTGFTVAGTALDTSTYNYEIRG